MRNRTNKKRRFLDPEKNVNFQNDRSPERGEIFLIGKNEWNRDNQLYSDISFSVNKINKINVFYCFVNSQSEK